jgi:hypothetical protein
MPGTDSDLKIRRKARFKRLTYWFMADLTVAAVIFALLLYTPGLYKPVAISPADNKKGQVHPYLTYLSSEIYNGAQRGEPFELVVAQKEINEIITWSQWPKESEGIMFSAPVVLFVPGSIVFMGTAYIKSVEVVVTIVLEPKVDEHGLLNLQVAKVKIGAMNITPLAKMVAKRMYAQRLAALPIDTDALQARIVGSLLNDEPFEPVIKVEGKKVRVEKITIAEEKSILHLVPAS